MKSINRFLMVMVMASTLPTLAGSLFAAVAETANDSDSEDQYFADMGCEKLHLWIAMGSTEMVFKVLESGVDVNGLNAKGQSPLDRAVDLHMDGFGSRVGIIKLLVDHGADINAENQDGLRPLDVAASVWQTKLNLIRDLLLLGADPRLVAESYQGNQMIKAAVKFINDRGVDAWIVNDEQKIRFELSGLFDEVHLVGMLHSFHAPLRVSSEYSGIIAGGYGNMHSGAGCIVS